MDRGDWQLQSMGLQVVGHNLHLHLATDTFTFLFFFFYINSLFTLNSNTDKRHINTKEVMRKRDAGWGSGALGAGSSAFPRHAASGRLSAALGTRSSGLIQV